MMIAVKFIWCLILLVNFLHAQPLDDNTRRKRGGDNVGLVKFPDTPVAGAQQKDEPILSEANSNTELERNARSTDDEYEDYEETVDGPEGRHLHKIKRKIKRKFKPHKYQNILGGFGGFGGFGGGGYGGHGGGHHHHQHGGHHHGGYDCRKLHGCGGFGGGWQQPSYGGGGPIATAIAGPSYGGGGWNPGFGGYGGNRPGSNAHAAAWNFGPFSLSLANAGK